ncbi:MAG: DUF2760 domain-containing protein, partial [Planctomycetia bacterium]
RVLVDRRFSDRAARILDGRTDEGLPPPAQVVEPKAAVPKTPVAPSLPAASPPKTADRSTDALRLLSLLQRDGRLVDFLSEDVSGYSDEQVGAAVRDIHRDCRAVLLRYVKLAPVVDKEEGESHTVPVGFDPSTVRLTGKVAGSAPFKGVLAHRGWKAAALDLPPVAPGVDPMILAPAEVEVS